MMNRQKTTRKQTTQIARLPRAVNIVPDIVLTKLRLYESLTNFTASVSYYGNIFRLNSLYDPDYTGTGSQPSGFDEWSFFYTNYRVMSVKVTMETLAVSASSNFAPSLIFGFYPEVTTNTETTMENALSKPRCVHSTSGWNATMGKKLTKVFTPAQILGLTPEQYRTDTGTMAAVSTNPTNVAYLNAFCFNMGGTWSASASSNPTLMVTLEFEVEFFGRKDLDLSYEKQIRKAFKVPPSVEEIIHAVDVSRRLGSYKEESRDDPLPVKKH